MQVADHDRDALAILDRSQGITTGPRHDHLVSRREDALHHREHRFVVVDAADGWLLGWHREPQCGGRANLVSTLGRDSDRCPWADAPGERFGTAGDWR